MALIFMSASLQAILYFFPDKLLLTESILFPKIAITWISLAVIGFGAILFLRREVGDQLAFSISGYHKK